MSLLTDSEYSQLPSLLPPIIFLEVHRDDASREAMLKLFPILKNKGYKTFFDEFDKELNIKERIAKGKDFLDEIKKNLTEGSHDSYRKDVERKEKAFEKTCKFLKEVEKHGLGYVGIDKDIGVEDRNFSPSLNEMLERNKEIVSNLADVAYSNRGSVFGTIGIKHYSAVKERLRKHHCGETAVEDFIFICMSSGLTQDQQDYIQDETKKLGSNHINMDSKTVDAAVEQVSSIIDAAIERMPGKQGAHFRISLHETYIKKYSTGSFVRDREEEKKNLGSINTFNRNNTFEDKDEHALAKIVSGGIGELIKLKNELRKTKGKPESLINEGKNEAIERA